MNVALICAYFTERIEPDAESRAARIASALRARGDRVTVLTTCGASEARPRAFPAGESNDGGVRMLRFRIDRADARRRDALRARLASGSESAALRAARFGEIETDAFVANSVNCTPLLSYLARHTDEFDAIAFLGGDTGIALRGWRIAPERTVVFAHVEDAPQTYLQPVVAMLLGVGRVAVASEGERDLLRQIAGPASVTRSSDVGSLAAHAEESFDRLRDALVAVAAARGPGPRNEGAQIVHRLARAEYAESTTLLALAVDELLREAGYRSRVVAEERDYRLGAQVAAPDEVDDEDERLDVVYGNDAPANGAVGRISLEGPLPTFEAPDGKRVPIPPYLNVEAWNVEPSLEVLAPLADGKTNLLCVGDVTPANRTLQLVEVFRYYVTMDFQARLIIVGPEPNPAYAQRIRDYVERCGLGGRVQVTGTVSQPALAALYRTARAFVSLRERYETGRSLLEAMAFDVPICVLDTPSARAVTGRKTILFSEVKSAFEIAALWRVTVRDEAFRDRIVASQRSYLATLTRDRTRRALEDALGLAADLVRA